MQVNNALGRPILFDIQRAFDNTPSVTYIVCKTGTQCRGSFAPKTQEKYFLGRYRVKFGHFVNLHTFLFSDKMSCPPPKLTELLHVRLW